MSAITASRRKDLSDGFYLYKNIYLIGLRSKAWDEILVSASGARRVILIMPRHLYSGVLSRPYSFRFSNLLINIDGDVALQASIFLT